MEVQHRNGTKIYCLSNGGPSASTLLHSSHGNTSLSNKAKKAENRHRVDLIQDFEFPIASNQLRQSPDGKFIVATGTYQPRMRCYELSEYSMKFERYLDSESIDLAYLSSDFGKLAFLCADRYIRFHAPYGHHTEMRIPSFGRAMAYEMSNCTLMVPARNGLVYRLDLEEGRFRAPLVPREHFVTPNRGSGNKNSSVFSGACIEVSPAHSLTGVGCEDGVVRFWDNRSGNAPFVNVDVAAALRSSNFNSGNGNDNDNDLYYNISGKNPKEIASLCYSDSGMHMAVGTRGGCVLLYDMRSSKPMHILEHRNGLPIHTVRFHKNLNNNEECVMSGDARLIKVWRSRGGDIGSIVTNIEGKGGDLNHFIVAGDDRSSSSGVILCASEQSQLQSFYCPALGRAPRWCGYLDNITEELEEKSSTLKDGSVENATSDQVQLYDDSKFVTHEELEQLGCTKLIGTPMLRGYMHGYFMDIGLYNRVRAIANPFEYDEYRKKKVREKLEAKRASRIAPKPKRRAARDVQVNANLAARLKEKLEKEGSSKSKNKKSNQAAKTMLEDNRFGQLFNNPDFQIDEGAEDFRLRNASGVSQKNRGNNDDDMDSDRESDDEPNESRLDDDNAGFVQVVRDQIDNESEYSSSFQDASSSDEDSDEDGFRGGKVRGEIYEETKSALKSSSSQKLKNQNKAKEVKLEKKRRAEKNIMFEADNYGDSNKDAIALGLGDTKARAAVKEKKKREHLPLEQRLALNQASVIPLEYRSAKTAGGSKEVAYVPRDTRKKMEQALKDRGEERGQQRKRRGVKELKLSKPASSFNRMRR